MGSIFGCKSWEVAQKLCHLKKSSWNHDWELTNIFPNQIKRGTKLLSLTTVIEGGELILCFAIYEAFSFSDAIFITTAWSGRVMIILNF